MSDNIHGQKENNPDRRLRSPELGLVLKEVELL